MSALTKIFVVLLVVLSIVETAGMVVYVNRSEQFATTVKNLNGKLAAATAEVGSANDKAAMANTARQQLQQQMQAQIDAKVAQLNTIQGQLASEAARVAELEGNVAQMAAANKSANDALQVAQKSYDTINTQMADLRKAHTDLEKQYAEATFAINDLTNKYDVTNRNWRDANEQITQLNSELQKARDTLHRAGIAANTNVQGEPLLNVQGVVRSKQNIGGIPYATISVGSADQVTKGMQFKVIDPQARNPFLGYLIVDRVEPNQAIGRLEGPHVNEVHPGVQVRTQLNG